MPDRIAEGALTSADLDDARAAVRAFLQTRTKADVLDAAMEQRLLCVPIFDMADVAAGDQLAARGFWDEVDIDGRRVAIPGRMARVTGAGGPRVRRRAPRIGEHTEEILAEWAAGGDPAAVREREAASRSSGPVSALDGLKVLDLSWVVAGPLIGRALADFGALVVRAESGTRVETARLMQPFYGGVQGTENSALYGNCNAGQARPDGRSEE
ncbi:CoA transferase [Actinomadura madurae]|uniref:CoA transferase n=1 Tax=Actinomadura madurae TaxID=1993 RepID=UPI0020D22576|nr:CoA transferase [Actinomadura madurae]MCQ0013653.1 CoA transferase [Actinomadura madurae]